MIREGGYHITELLMGNINCTRDMVTMSTRQEQIAQRAKTYAEEGLTNLHQFIDSDWLEESMRELNKRSASGIDGETYKSYTMQQEEKLPVLLRNFKNGTYKAPPVKRVYIKKEDGKERPLGIPTIEDKVLQNAVRKLLDPIYEAIFKDYSYAFRKGKSQHQALERVWQEIMRNRISYILDADIQDYFGSINHRELRKILDKRVKDGVVRKQIDKWLKAGILEDETLRYAKEGIPQGGIISPLISNIYLHEVLDTWYEEIKPLLKGRSFMVRYADDFVMGFEYKEDSERVMRVIFKRFAKYALTLHPEKTKLLRLGNAGEKSGTFDFLGFTHFIGKSRKGAQVLKRKTSRKKFRKSLKTLNRWCKFNRHMKLKDLIEELNRKLRGHYQYYGITFNSRGISMYYYKVKRILFKWINRRGGKKKYKWEKYIRIIIDIYPLLKPRICHNYLLAKP